MLYAVERKRIFVRGIVQGVGFRPFLYALAAKHGLTGTVSNHSDGVSLEIQGSPADITAFVHTLRSAPPPLAVIDALDVQQMATITESAFRILESASQPNASTPISPDIAVCADCLREFLDPADRRYRYPFINCTNCGPRFTIIRDIPYDRPNTTMAPFKMCAQCQAEYDSPDNRRFHAQPNACAACGPKIWLQRGTDRIWEQAAIQSARAALARGEILAIKGIGGFHLAVDATNDEAVAKLRERKGRRDKPFALMALNLDIVSQHAFLGNAQMKILQSRQRPVVLLPRNRHSAIAPSVAPGNPLVGFMLPYAPLHYLLLEDRLLVMTSGNLSEEPIVWRNEEAITRLAHIADAFLLHDRDIHVPCDDSVVNVYAGCELPIRRSRGYSPMPVKLAVERPATLAVGAELKACFCLTRGGYAYLSQHIGDMENLETVDAFERALDHMKTLFRCQPERVVCDTHPEYLSTRWARTYAQTNNLPLVEVQHHHAHALSLMTEHGLPEDATVLTFAFDGTGYGTDRAIWGGEVLLAGYGGFNRFAHLKYVPLPGGDSAIRHPARTALAHLFAAGIEWDTDLACAEACTPVELRILRRQLTAGTHSVQTSSMGRLFDAVAALLGIRRSVSYEGQAAIELEALCAENTKLPRPYPITFANSQFDITPMWVAMIADLRAHVQLAHIAACFHQTISEIILHFSRRARTEFGLETVGLTGGVFQNVYLTKSAQDSLTKDGFRVLTHHTVPPNDGGIALGQAAICTSPIT